MKRAIIVPAQPAPEALAELKQWLAITTSGEDLALSHLIAAGLDLLESFTGVTPLSCGCEEVLAASPCWQTLSTLPVQGLVGVEAVAIDAQRTPLPEGAYEIELDPGGAAQVRVFDPAGATRVAVQFVAGMVPTWPELPEGLRHGVIRFAAHLYRLRDGQAAEAVPPAAVTALWRPWRRMRLA